MLDTKALSPEALLQITNSLNISMHSLVAVIGLLESLLIREPRVLSYVSHSAERT